ATVLSRCRVDRLRLQGGRATAVEGTLLGPDDVTPTGARVVVEAKHVVLSGGAINSPALLLRSGFDGDGRVGRRTYLHPTVAQFGVYPEPIEGYYGAPQSIASHHFAHRGDEVGFMLETAPVHPVMASMALPSFGAEHAAAMQR